jgi:predicted nucleotidyltransferase
MTPQAPPAPPEVVREFHRRLAAHFGPRLLRLVLFGSYARGEAGPDSDVDVAVVLDRIDGHAERVWPMQLSGELEGPLLVPIVLSRSELSLLQAREDALAESLARDGIEIHLEAA